MLVISYDINWVNQFEKIKLELTKIFGDLSTDIQHFGSTAIIGMCAKPIIDVMVIVNDITKVDILNEKMKQAGYIPKGENGISGRRYFQMFDNDGINHTQHIHCYEKDNQNAIHELMFRDYLLVDNEAFHTYKAIKIEASHKYRFSPQEYTEYKSACVNEIMKKAKLYFTKERTL
jgi:GrpB-like predicted nucleotidyltransferase (UPF0157 family)